MGRRGALALAAMLAGAIGFALPGCTTKNCDFGAADFKGTGHFLAEDVWESAPADGEWAEFPGNFWLAFRIPRWATEGRPMVEMHAYVRAEATCSGDCPAFVEVAGNDVEFAFAAPGAITAIGGTCAHHYLRVVLRAGAPTLGTDAGPLDTTTNTTTNTTPPIDVRAPTPQGHEPEM